MSIDRSLRILTAASLLIVTVFTLQPPQAAYAQSIEINSTADVIADDGQCTLREAIIAANTDTASGTLAGECRAGSGTDVVYVPNGTYTLTSGSELMISSELWLIGQSEAGTIIQAAAAPDTVNYRVMFLNSNNVRLGRLTIRNGGCTGCAVPLGPAEGGGLFNQGYDNYLLSVTISNNQAQTRGHGVYNTGRMIVANSTISNNGLALTTLYGGGIYTSGDLRIFNSTIANNIGGWGGGIAYYAPGQMLQVVNTTMGGNQSWVESAILVNGGAMLLVADSTIADNSGMQAIGVRWGNTNVTIDNSTISDGTGAQNNGLYFTSQGPVQIFNSTITGFSWAGIAAPQGFAGPMEIINSTIASNGRHGIERGTGTINVTNSIIANNGMANCTNLVNSNGHNIISDAGCFVTPQPTDLMSTDPLLGALADNGGPTRTMALQAGSPAIDQGDDAACSLIVSVGSVDQRGAIRPVDDPGSPGTACDIGAYEVGGAPNEYPDFYNYNTNVVEDATLNGVVPFNDPDGDSLRIYSPASLNPVNDQAFVLNLDGTFAYTPQPDFNGYDAFIYLSDHDSDPPTINRYRETYSLVLIPVNLLNDPPVNTVPATATVAVSVPTGIGGVSVDDPDVDENPGGQMQITLTATNGTANVPGTSGATVTNNGTANVTITGTLTQVNTELAGIQFTGAALGAATLQVRSDDLGNWGAPGALTDTDLINITVTDAPPPQPGGGGGSGSGAASTAPACQASVVVKAGRPVVSIGDPVQWAIEIRNTGSVDCHGLLLLGTFSDAFIIRDIVSSHGTVTRDDPRFEVNLGTIGIGQVIKITIDTLIGSGAGFSLPAGSAGQTAGTEYCLTGLVNSTTGIGCVTLFPDTLPSTGGQPVKERGLWIVAGLIGLLAVGSWWLIGRKRLSAN